MGIKGKPDITQFIEDGETAEGRSMPAQKKAGKTALPEGSPHPKRKKLVELPAPVFDALKDRAYEEYKRVGRRVTETEIIIAALSQYLGV